MKKLLLFIIAIIIIYQSCTVNYTLSGASIAPEVKTVSIQYFVNRAPEGGIANLEQYFTDALKDKFKDQTNLTLVNDMGDLNFEGYITKYDPTRPMAIKGDELAAQNRFTIEVQVKFTNEVQPEWNFDQKFSQYDDYDASIDISSIEQEEVEIIIEKLIEDIFNKAVVNW